METIRLLERATGDKGEGAVDWMAASKDRSLAIGDPSLIWLDYHGEQYDLERDPTEYSFFNFIC